MESFNWPNEESGTLVYGEDSGREVPREGVKNQQEEGGGEKSGVPCRMN